MSLCIGVGLRKRASVPALVFGKAMTSRIEVVLHRMATRRSKPMEYETIPINSYDNPDNHGPALTQRNSTMWRGAAAQGVKQMVEGCFFIFIELRYASQRYKSEGRGITHL
jgi:hypothetical protein